MQQWIFETPWWLLCLIAVAAVGLLLSGNNRQNKNLKLAGVGVFALGAALWATSYFVETPREICTRQTREWVRAVVAKDATKLGVLLHSTAGLAAWNRDDILAGSVKYAEQYGLSTATIISLDAQPDPVMVKTSLTVLSKHDAKMAVYDTVNSSWELNWIKNAQGQWQIRDIKPLKIGQVDQTSVTSMLFKVSPR